MIKTIRMDATHPLTSPLPCPACKCVEEHPAPFLVFIGTEVVKVGAEWPSMWAVYRCYVCRNELKVMECPCFKPEDDKGC